VLGSIRQTPAVGPAYPPRGPHIEVCCYGANMPRSGAYLSRRRRQGQQWSDRRTRAGASCELGASFIAAVGATSGGELDTNPGIRTGDRSRKTTRPTISEFVVELRAA
jgi:hypothetical protein